MNNDVFILMNQTWAKSSDCNNIRDLVLQLADQALKSLLVGDICVLLVLFDQPAHLQHLEPDVLASFCPLPEGEDQVSCLDHVAHEEEKDIHALQFL